MVPPKVPQIREPLATTVLIQAGVPFQNVLWFSSLSPRGKMQALATERGEQILQLVRQFMARTHHPNQNAMAT